MTDTIEPVAMPIDQMQLAQQLVEQARAEGVELIGPDGLLTGLTKSVLETALEAHAEGVQVLEAALTCEWDWQASIWVTEAFPEDVRPAVRVLIEGTPLFDRVWADLEVASEQ